MESTLRQNKLNSIDTYTVTDSRGKHENQSSDNQDIRIRRPLLDSSATDENGGLQDHITAIPANRDRRFSQGSQHSSVAVGRRPIPAQRYSEEWWKRSWDSAIQHRVWPRVIYGLVFLLIMVVWLGATIVFASDQTNWADQQESQLTYTSATGGMQHQAPLKGLFGLKGALKSFDPVARSLTVEWSGYFKENATTDEQPLSPDQLGFSHPLNIYRDVSTILYNFGNSTASVLLDISIATSANGGSVLLQPLGNVTNPANITAVFPHFGHTLSYPHGTEGDDFHSQYVFRVDNTSTSHIGAIGLHEWDSFDTDISFGPKDSKASAFKQPLFGYPFDEWQGNVVFVATDPYYEDVLNLTGIAAFPLAGAILSDNTLNWRFTVDYNATCRNAIDRLYNYTHSGMLPPDNSLHLGDLPTQPPAFPCHLMVTINGGRPPLVKFAAVMAVVVNWTSTLFIFILTCESLIMRRGYMLSGTDLFGITFTALFALPSVRLLLPGAPDFGIIIDLIGIIPNVIIISLCITVIAVAKLNRVKKIEKDLED